MLVAFLFSTAITFPFSVCRVLCSVTPYTSIYNGRCILPYRHRMLPTPRSLAAPNWQSWQGEESEQGPES